MCELELAPRGTGERTLRGSAVARVGRDAGRGAIPGHRAARAAIAAGGCVHDCAKVCKLTENFMGINSHLRRG